MSATSAAICELMEPHWAFAAGFLVSVSVNRSWVTRVKSNVGLLGSGLSHPKLNKSANLKSPQIRDFSQPGHNIYCQHSNLPRPRHSENLGISAAHSKSRIVSVPISTKVCSALNLSENTFGKSWMLFLCSDSCQLLSSLLGSQWQSWAWILKLILFLLFRWT